MPGLRLPDAGRLRYLVGAALARNGKSGSFETVGGDAYSDTRRLHLFAVDGSTVEMVGDFGNPRHASWSPNSERVAFVVDRRDGVSIVVADHAGLPEWAMGTAFKQIDSIDWSPSGTALVFSARPTETIDRTKPYRVTRHTFRFDGYGWIDDAIRDIYTVDLESNEVNRLTNDRAINEEPKWSPDGSAILWRQSFHPDRVWTAKPSIWVLELGSSTRTELLERWGGAFAATWSLDSSQIVFAGVQSNDQIADAYWQKADLWVTPREGGAITNCTDSLPCGVGNFLEYDHPTYGLLHSPRIYPTTGARVLVSGQQGGVVDVLAVAITERHASERIISENDATSFVCGASDDGDHVLYIRSTLLDPPDLYLRDRTRDLRITDLNSEVLAGIDRPIVRRLDVQAIDGTRLDTWAVTPQAPGPWPTVLCIHGGPNDSYGCVFMVEHHLLAAHGIAVVFSNFRGSGGYGNQFHSSLGGEWGPAGQPDHIAALDQAVSDGIADPNRLGVYGLSHGGFASTWLASRTNRFRAAVAENPVTNFHSEFATMDSDWWLPRVLGATPRQMPDAYVRLSPLTYADDCTAAMLFIVGESDYRCPPTEAEQFFKALKQRGATTEMLRMPDASHVASWIGRGLTRAAQDEALIDWFVRHL